MNTRAATVNRGEIVSMYAGLYSLDDDSGGAIFSDNVQSTWACSSLMQCRIQAVRLCSTQCVHVYQRTNIVMD